jgi:hypothetical protein
MKSTEQTQTNSAKTYKSLLLEAKDLRKQGGVNAYKRAVLLKKVYDDQDFRADHETFDDDKLLDILNEYVDDLCTTFLELKLLLDHFPDESQWADGKLYSMLREVMTEAKAEPQPKSKKKKEDPWQYARKEKARLQAIIDQLMERIKDLEIENKRLRERLEKKQPSRV